MKVKMVEVIERLGAQEKGGDFAPISKASAFATCARRVAQ